jgi:predicted P-loop ATPase
VRDYLHALPEHDKKPRLSKWLVTYLGAEDSPYIRAVGRMFLISMVARVEQPGCKVDYTLILESEQGGEKSKIGGVLGGEWFSDNLPDIRSGKEASQHLRGKWLLEMPELHARSQADENLLKAFMTRQTERYRPPFGRIEVIEPRQCVFYGSTNLILYLKDPTGARRDWPVRVGKIDIEGLLRDRDQLFAEALAAYRSGEHWWPEREFEREHMQPEQEARFEADGWEEPIINWTTVFFAKEGERATKCVCAGTILGGALHLEANERGTSHIRRIAGIMARLGWKRSTKQGKGWLRGKHYWMPPGVSEEAALAAMGEEGPPMPRGDETW